MSNVLAFRKPSAPQSPPNLLYSIDIYDNGDTVVHDPNNSEVDKAAMVEKLLDATHDIVHDAADGLLLISIRNETTTSIRDKEVANTRARKDWLARRLDDVYEMVAHERRSRNLLAAFFQRLFIPTVETTND